MDQEEEVDEGVMDQMLQQINRKFRTKVSLYDYLTVKTMLFLPRPDYCTLEFMHQLLTAQKIMQHQNQVPQEVKIPNWPELSVRAVWPHATQLPGVLERIPDEWDGGIRTDRVFFWCTVMGIHSQWVDALVNDCTLKRRQRAAARHMPRQTIQIPPSMARRLLEHEYGIRDIQEPIRGASLFAARRQRQRAAGQVRQPQAIVPNFRTQEYIQQYQEEVVNQSQQNMPGSQADVQSMNGNIQPEQLFQGAHIPVPEEQKQPPNSQAASGRPPLAPGSRQRSHSVGHNSFESFNAQSQAPNMQIRPEMGNSNATMMVGSGERMNRRHSQQPPTQVIVERSDEDEQQQRPFNPDLNQSLPFPTSLQDPNFNALQNQEHDPLDDDDDQG